MDNIIEIINETLNEKINIKINCATNKTSKQPIVIILTGDTPSGMKGMSSVNFIKLLNEAGITSVSFDFRGCGYSTYDNTYLTLTSGIEYFKSVCEYVKNLEWVDYSKIGVFGTSFGANVAICCSDLINTFACVGFRSPAPFLAQAYINDIGINEFHIWREKKFSKVNNYNYEVLIDSLKYNIFDYAKKIKIPSMIIHGESDEIVPVYQSLLLYDTLNCKKEIKIIKGANHNYYSGANSNDKWEEMASNMIEWLTCNLK